MQTHIDGLVQERRNSSALAMELRLSCTNPALIIQKHNWNGPAILNPFLTIPFEGDLENDDSQISLFQFWKETTLTVLREIFQIFLHDLPYLLSNQH